jgi:adenosine 3'-phospho 5'-phosphosulfate transporter B2
VEEVRPVAPLASYAAVSLSNVVATFCQYEALKYVSYPVQTLGKCAKMLPVMIWGILIMRKRYGVRDFSLALAVTGGCTLFLLTGNVKSKARAVGLGIIGQPGNLHSQHRPLCD